MHGTAEDQSASWTVWGTGATAVAVFVLFRRIEGCVNVLCATADIGEALGKERMPPPLFCRRLTLPVEAELDLDLECGRVIAVDGVRIVLGICHCCRF